MYKRREKVVAKILEENWYNQAQCRGTDSSLFFGSDAENNRSAPARVRKAQAICSECVVRNECLEFAIRTGQTEGVWGGTSEKARKAMMRNKKRRT